ncbi:MAG: thioredoxin fold domain-containing protein [Gammaproteobacteria bacterium]|nr:thioredoxin fold domain-containing protein [Gammaproteobacteria bacterium]
MSYRVAVLLVISTLAIMIIPGAGLSTQNSPETEVELIEVQNLSADGRVARERNVPILMLVSQVTCPYCDQIKQEILHPMLAAGDYQGELMMRELHIDSGAELKDFQGRAVERRQFAHGYNVYLTPTLLFLDSKGRELTKRMVGINTPEMYFYYVDESIKAAINALP